MWFLPDLFQLEAKVKNFASQHKFYDSIPPLHDGFINPNHQPRVFKCHSTGLKEKPGTKKYTCQNGN